VNHITDSSPKKHSPWASPRIKQNNPRTAAKQKHNKQENKSFKISAPRSGQTKQNK
jgi:hypothetical protein